MLVYNRGVAWWLGGGWKPRTAAWHPVWGGSLLIAWRPAAPQWVSATHLRRMSPVDGHVVSFLVAWAGIKTIRRLVSVEEEYWNSLPLILSQSSCKTIQHLVSVDINVHFALRVPSLILAKKLINREKSAQITVLRGNCGDHKIIFTTFRDVGKPEQVKSKHLQFLLLVQRKATSSFLYQNFI